MRVLIVTGGKSPSSKLILQEYNKADFVIGADSGCNALYKNNLNPNMILGDFDSIDVDVLKSIKERHIEVKIFPVEKDYTDTELAVYRAIDLKATEIILLGATGSRLDHVMGNIGLLKYALQKGIRATIKDDNNEIFMVDKSVSLKKSFGQTFSLQAYEAKVENLTVENAKYYLENHDLEVGSPLTISNEFLNENVNIKFTRGKLLIFYTKD
ncbi:MAG: thiamine diphosphokinase [Clostridium sp.]